MRRTVDFHIRGIASPFKPFLSSSTCTAITSTRLHSSLTKINFATAQFPSKTISLASHASSCSQPGLCSVSLVFKCHSPLSSPNSRKLHRYSAVESSEAVSSSDLSDSLDAGGDDNDEVSRPAIPVRAFFLSTSIDLKGLAEQNKPNFISSTSRTTNYVVLKFGELSSFQEEGSYISGSSSCFMVVFQYGATVLFNAPDHEVDNYLTIIRRHASGLLPEVKKDEYEVRENPNSKTWMQAGLDHLVLQFLNIDGIRTIGSVLGQSIALDYYGRQVDGMVAEFTDINREMEKTGTFSMDSKKLFQIVGRANSNLADVILKLGLFERSDIAWKDAKYGQIWEYLRDEFELTQRFASLDFKLKFVEHNIRFLQEILQNRKSDFLEWLIIILISVEIAISVFDLATRSGFKFLKLK